MCCCFAQSVASTRWLLQDRLAIRNTQCDNCIIGTMVCLQYLDCLCSIAACLTDNELIDQMAECVDCLADVTWCTVCACMQTQARYEMNENPRWTGGGGGGAYTVRAPLCCEVLVLWRLVCCTHAQSARLCACSLLAPHHARHWHGKLHVVYTRTHPELPSAAQHLCRAALHLRCSCSSQSSSCPCFTVLSFAVGTSAAAHGVPRSRWLRQAQPAAAASGDAAPWRRGAATPGIPCSSAGPRAATRLPAHMIATVAANNLLCEAVCQNGATTVVYGTPE